MVASEAISFFPFIFRRRRPARCRGGRDHAPGVLVAQLDAAACATFFFFFYSAFFSSLALRFLYLGRRRLQRSADWREEGTAVSRAPCRAAARASAAAAAELDYRAPTPDLLRGRRGGEGRVCGWRFTSAARQWGH